MPSSRHHWGSHFDPDIAAAFLEIEDEFRTIAARFSDGEAELARKREYIEQASGAL